MSPSAGSSQTPPHGKVGARAASSKASASRQKTTSKTSTDETVSRLAGEVAQLSAEVAELRALLSTRTDGRNESLSAGVPIRSVSLALRKDASRIQQFVAKSFPDTKSVVDEYGWIMLTIRDSRFAKLGVAERESLVQPILDQLPENQFRQIMGLHLHAPGESA